MHTVLAEKLVVKSAPENSDASRAVVLHGQGNGIEVDVVVHDLSGSLTVSLQGSNDMDNWSQIGAMSAISSPGYASAKFHDSDGIAFRAVRLRYSVSGVGNIAVVEAGLNVADL